MHQKAKSVNGNETENILNGSEPSSNAPPFNTSARSPIDEEVSHNAIASQVVLSFPPRTLCLFVKDDG